MPALSSTKATAQALLAHDGRASLALEHLGLLTWAEKLDRIRCGGDIAHIPLPLGRGQLRAQRVRMYREQGRDLAVRAFTERGWRGFEHPFPDVFVRTARSVDGRVYDVGANSGLYALLAVEANRRTEVSAFEPFPPVLDVLRRNVALSRGAKRIEIIEGAASDAVGTSTLYVPRDTGAVETSASLDGTFKDDIVDEIKVPTTTLDDFWASQARPHVAILKIDTEGTEHRVLHGAAAVIDRCRPITFFEVLPRAAFDELTAFGREHDLLDVRLTPAGVQFTGEVAFDPDGWNHAFVPREHRDLFAAVLDETGLEVQPGR